jgi:hypothetical protein
MWSATLYVSFVPRTVRPGLDLQLENTWRRIEPKLSATCARANSGRRDGDGVGAYWWVVLLEAEYVGGQKNSRQQTEGVKVVRE